jgi:hypothetical protein
MTKQKAIEHARSAALTFGTAFAVELYMILEVATGFEDVGVVALKACLFAAVRTTFRVSLNK